MSLYEELKRRRVFRVAGAYIVGAWIVLQASDILAPALHLPPWTVTVVAVIAIVGFPIALLLGWLFDLTPGGIERTASSFKFPVRSAFIASLVVAVGVSAFVIVRRRAVAAGLDANAVVVLPFRVAGDPSLASMREGMVDLLAAKLTGEGGPRAIDSRTTLSAWRRKVDNEKDDMPPADAVHLARSLGAGQVLLGEVVGTPGRVSINAVLHSSIDGRKLTTAEATASPDSMLQLVDQVVAKLLSQQAGQGYRTEALLSESLAAVRAYLDGQRHYRRGDYEPAAQYFRSALNEDSTFALAGLGLMLAREWTGRGPEHARGGRIAWAYRERLPQPDREYVLAFFGEKYPLPVSSEERVRAWQNILARAPDRAEVWYELGDDYFHAGARLGIDKPFDKAMEAWSRAVALDSSFMPALEHQFDVYVDRGDTANARRLADLVFTRVQPEQKYTNGVAWQTALLLGDRAWLDGLRSHLDTASADDAHYAHQYIVKRGLPQDDVRLIGTAAIRRANSPAAKESAVTGLAVSLLNMGQPNAARDVLKQLQNLSQTAYETKTLMLANSYVELDSRDLAAMAERMVQDSSLNARCFAQAYRIAHGELRNASDVIAGLRAASAARPADLAATIGYCAEQLEAELKVQTRAADARVAVARLDSLLVHGPIDVDWAQLYLLASARYHLLLGDHEGALKAARSAGPAAWAFAPLLLEQARAAARLGHRAEAIAAYERYLKVRANPEPGLATDIRNQARNELAALVGEPRR